MRMTSKGLVALIGVAVILVLQASAASATTATGWIRFGHFAPSNGPVRVQVDGKLLARDATFETVTPYDAVAAGPHTVTLTDVDAPGTVIREQVTVLPGGAVTVGAIQGSRGIELRQFADNLSPSPAGEAKVRIIDTAPTAPYVQVVLKLSTVREDSSSTGPQAPSRLVTPVVPYGTASAYVDVPSGSYSVAVLASGGRQIITGKGWPVLAGTVASVVVVASHGTPTLEVLRDAAGSSSSPVGGMQTGFGGAARLLAPGSHQRTAAAWAELVGLFAVAGTAAGATLWGLSRRSGWRRPVVAVSAVVAIAAVGACAGTQRSATPARAAGRAAPEVVPTAPLATVGASPRTSAGSSPRAAAGRSATVSLASDASGSTGVAPTSLTIPSIAVTARVVKLGLNADGSAQVPATTTVAGWYRNGPAPGQPGPAVILGHVDSYRGPGIFFNLRTLVSGALIRVGEAGRTLTFRVQQVSSYPKTRFPTAAVFGPTPDRALRLVTCGGAFDSATGHYVDNVVVFATEVGTPA